MRHLAAPFPLILLAACGAQPTQPAANAAGVPPPTATAAAPTAAPAAPAAGATVAAASAGAAAAVSKPPPGFRLVKRGGQELYCRSEATIGSKLPETLCYTRDQLDEIEERTNSTMDALGRGCVGPNCGGE
jgi:hypothetical protein